MYIKLNTTSLAKRCNGMSAMPRQMLRVIQQQDLIIFIYVINNIYIADTHSSKRQPKKGGEAQTYKKKKKKRKVNQ